MGCDHKPIRFHAPKPCGYHITTTAPTVVATSCWVWGRILLLYGQQHPLESYSTSSIISLPAFWHNHNSGVASETDKTLPNVEGPDFCSIRFLAYLT